MDEHIFIDEYPVGDSGYELGETIDDVQYVDNIDHSADFLNPSYIDEEILMCDPLTGDMALVNKLSLKELCEKLNNDFKKLAKELQETGYLAGNCVVRAIDDTFGIERPNTMYGDKQGFVRIDEWAAFDNDFTGPEEDIEKLEPAEPVYDISWIRKRMKCCKNPMERKQLEKQLNEAFKAKKKARKKK